MIKLDVNSLVFLGKLSRDTYKILFSEFDMDSTNQVSETNILNLVLTPQESCAGIMLAAVAVDGFMAEEELRNVMTTVKRMKLFDQHSQAEIVQMLKKLLKIIKSNSVDALLESAIPNLPEYLYETIFAIATDITLSDGAIFNEEMQMLSKLSHSLEIPETTADQIIKVMMIKNKG